jgi:hypothetical protein
LANASVSMPMGNALTRVRRPSISHQSPLGDSARIGAHDAVAEIIGIGLGLKTNDIIGPERAKDSLISGQSAGHFRPRPGNMHEKADPVDAAQLAQDSRHRNEMIVVHPNDVVPAQHLVELPGELFVHPEIGGGVALRQIGEIETIMTDWPTAPGWRSHDNIVRYRGVKDRTPRR